MGELKGFSSYERETCRICGSSNLYEYLDLGEQPPSNSFVSEDDILGGEELLFPLRIVLCQDCGLSQLKDVVSAANIFDDYLYLASSSTALRNHYIKMVSQLFQRYQIPRGSLVIDIGCNDGILLKAFPTGSYRLLGVEPSSAGKFAKAAGFDVIPEFFDEELATKLRKKIGGAMLITATNVYAHVDDLQSFTSGIKSMLSPEGIYVSEFPYIEDMLKDGYFDTIYHEHLSYFALTPLVQLLKSSGLQAIRVERVSIGASGPALRLFVAHIGSSYVPDPTVETTLHNEEAWEVKTEKPYVAFANRVAVFKSEFTGKINALNRSGNKVGAFTAPAKGNTLLNYLF